MKYTGRIVDGFVVEATVGTAELATVLFGGEWRESDEKIPIGWMWDDDQGFVSPPASAEE